MTMIFLVYIKTYSSDQIYDLLENTVSKSDEECAALFTYAVGHEKAGQSFFGDPEDRNYSCGPIAGNRDGSYLTMLSSGGLMFGIINIVGNFGTVFVDQSYWQSAIAARPESAARGYLLGG
jgi:urea-proton symporter